MKFYARIARPDGAYVDAAGERYDVSVIRRSRSHLGINVGYEPFPSLETALEVWGIEPV